MRAAAIVGSTGALVTGLMLAAAGPAGASTLSCGDTITSDVTLHQNLDCSAYTSGPALIIGAPGVQVDLHGHQILGPGAAADTPGILGGFSRDIVKDGTVSDFAAGVAFEPAGSSYLKRVVVRDLRVTNAAMGSAFGVIAAGLDHARISHVTTAGPFAGVFLFLSRYSTISHSTLKYDFFGAIDEGGKHNTFSDNRAHAYPDGAGILLAQTRGDAVRDNLVGGKGGAGIADSSSAGLHASGNTLSHLLYGMLLENTVKSLVSDNKGTADGWGLALTGNDHVSLTGNTFRNGGFGIEADYPANLVVEHNLTNHNSEIGVYLYDGSAPPVAGKRSGAIPSAYSALVSFNKANYNSIGFYSLFPTTGHGNDADHNTLLGCFNVSCIHGMTKLHASIALPAHHAFPVPALPKKPALKK
ncbi:MAG: right-handed parallel beta-helix repeat-containing protein [Gemmatimonadota bacterium]